MNGLSESNNYSLASSFRVSEVSDSDLKGFELPLLSSFEDKAKASLISEGIKQVGQFEITSDIDGQPQKQALQTTADLIDTILKNLFDQSLNEVTK